jgi:hypothetical protein
MSSTMLEMRGQFNQLSQLMVVMGNKRDIVMKAPQDKTGFQERTIFQRNAKQTQTETRSNSLLMIMSQHIMMNNGPQDSSTYKSPDV